MSHAPERKEKDCLNCGTTVQGHYCQHCGQENVVTKESFGKLALHFFYDITHFDGKFFHSIKFLVSRPGFLSKEYMKGRRAKYLNPIRMYVFTSAFFFLVFFALRGTGDAINYTESPLTQAERDSALVQDRLELAKDTGNYNIRKRMELYADTSRELLPSQLYTFYDDYSVVSTIRGDYRNLAEYDSIQRVLPKNKRDGWLVRLWNKRAIAVNEKYRHDPKQSMEKMSETIMHMMPYLLFVSLPFFALILKLLYFRKKQWYFADHGIFTVHHYVLCFILLLFLFVWDSLGDWTGWRIFNFFTAITIISLPVVLFLAMKRFYGQSGGKTFLKFVLLNILGLIMILILLVIFFLLSIFQM